MMGINDFKDTIELDNITRNFLDMLKADMVRADPANKDVDDITALRFATLLTFRLGRTEHNEMISGHMSNALALALKDPAIVEESLFRS